MFVAPDAPPGGDGSREHPLASIEVARDRLRAREVAADAPSPAIVLLDGTFAVERGLVFDARDDGLSLIADDGSRPRLVGGRVFVAPRLRPLDDARLLARLPSDAARAAVRVLELPADLVPAGPVRRGMGSPVVPVGSEVFVDGVALRRARWPDDGFARVGEVLDRGSVPRDREDDVPEARRETGPERGGTFRPADVDARRLARWASAEDAWALGFWCWDWADEQLPIAAIDVAAGTIALGAPHRYGLKAGTTFYVTNLLEELDRPGEFFFDVAGGRLLLWPPATQPRELVVSTLDEPLLRLDGSHGFTLEGLSFEDTRGPAVVGDDCDGVRITRCTITNTGTDGIRLRGRDDVVGDCTLRGIGATGVSLDGGDRATLTHADDRLERTSIHDFGRLYRTYQPAVRLAGVGQVVIGNEFAHAPHSAILFAGNEHVIAGNEIFDVLRETGDSGAIYCGRDWTLHGTRIEGNFIHHLGGSDGRWQNAIYLDDMASGIEVARNVVWRCHWGMLVGGGRDLDIHDNLFVACALGIRFDARGIGWMAEKIADPATSTLHRNLAAVPIASEPWASRYPSLGRYLDDRFGRPVGSRVVGNRFVATPFGSVDDPECVQVDANVETSELPAWADDGLYFDAGPRLGERRRVPAPNEVPIAVLDGRG
ncbi:MAG: right-handed parallel beta-helix repeat-containing protein [Planctomycetes bacterium]|nr:right-handed parallel beta-helix repeat-containing protein [Planctomycetota bacterium]